MGGWGQDWILRSGASGGNDQISSAKYQMGTKNPMFGVAGAGIGP
jgi:hypothetical protein